MASCLAPPGALVFHQRTEGAGHQVPQVPAFIFQPVLETWVGNLEAVEQIAPVQDNGRFEIMWRAAGNQSLE